jgi:riboflavin synthase
LFTGLIETVGKIERVTPRGNYRVLTISSSLPTNEIAIGDSIACGGPCLTVVEKDAGTFTVELSQETAERVKLGRYAVGDRINLERALRVGSRLGGHFVSGHIDTTGEVKRIKPVGQSLDLKVGYEPRFDQLVIEKGSIAIDGVSLTVNECGPGWLTVNLIPHTGAETTLSELKAGEIVNLEFDLIGKYVIKMQQSRGQSGLTAEILRESGW